MEAGTLVTSSAKNEDLHLRFMKLPENVAADLNIVPQQNQDPFLLSCSSILWTYRIYCRV